MLTTKLHEGGIRVVYQLLEVDGAMRIVLVGMRADNEVYPEAARRPGRWEPDGGTRLLAYLVGSAVNGMVLDEDSVARIDLDEPVRVASHHMLTATIAPAPEVAGTDDGRFARALRQCIDHGGGSV